MREENMLCELEMGRVIGRGRTGRVYAANTLQTKTVAVKVIDMQMIHSTVRVPIEKIEKSVQNEMDALHKLQHPHIVSLEFSFVSEQIAYIGMEYIEGYSLLHYIPKNGLSESVGSVLFSQLCRAVAYCHSYEVIHGDINLKNILIRHSDRTLKLIDFGSSHTHSVTQTEETKGHWFNEEKINLFAPPPNEPVTFRWDAWSCGVVLYVMVNGVLPFGEKSLREQSVKPMLLYIPECLSDAIVDVLTALLRTQRSKRSSIASIVNSPWLRHIPTTTSLSPSSLPLIRPPSSSSKKGRISQMKGAESLPKKEVKAIPEIGDGFPSEYVLQLPHSVVDVTESVLVSAFSFFDPPELSYLKTSKSKVEEEEEGK